jgi:hypothetical protein
LRIIEPAIHWARQHASALRKAFWTLGGLAVLGVLAYQIIINWDQIKELAWQLDPIYLLLGFPAYSVSLLSSAGVWAWIASRVTGRKGPLLHASLYAMTNVAQRLPTPIPYIGARIEAYAARGVPRRDTVTAMSLDITITITGALAASLITLPFGLPGAFQKEMYLSWLAVIPLIAVVLRPAWMFGVFKWLFAKIKREYIPPQVSPAEMLSWTGTYNLIWIFGGVLYYLLANSIFPIPPDRLPAMMNVFAVSGLTGWAGQMLFFIPTVAVRQITAAYLLSFFVPWPAAIAIALLTRLCVMAYELVWALLLGLVARNSVLPDR